MTRHTRIIVTVAVLLLASSGCGQTQRAPREEVSTSSAGKLSVVGTVTKYDGSPAVGEVVFLAEVKDGRVSTNFKIENGTTTGLLDPNSVTDAKGHFRIILEAPDIEVGKEFTLSILDCPKCFTLPTRRLVQNDLPVTFRIAKEDKAATGTKEINLGVVPMR
jgi:hypothetical protein